MAVHGSIENPRVNLDSYEYVQDDVHCAKKRF